MRGMIPKSLSPGVRNMKKQMSKKMVVKKPVKKTAKKGVAPLLTSKDEVKQLKKKKK